MLSFKNINRTTPICGFKDDQGKFHETKEWALRANKEAFLKSLFPSKRDPYSIYNSGYHDAAIVNILLKHKSEIIAALST